MSNELLPCPFCGQSLAQHRRRFNPFARCETANCKGAQLPCLNLDQPDDIERWNHRTQAVPPVTCATATSISARYNRAEDLQLRLLQVVDLASQLATDAFEGSLDDPLESFVDAVLDTPLQHPTLAPLAEVLGQPGWEKDEYESQRDHDRAVLQENAYDARMVFHGFGVQFGTPVREYRSSSSFIWSWGYYSTVWIYAETVEKAWLLGCEWAEQKHLQAREKAGVSEVPGDA